MPGRPSQWVKLGIAGVLFISAGISLYLNADVVRAYLSPKKSAAPKVEVAPPAPPIPRPERPVYPDRPTVAILDFGVDRDTYLGEQTAIGLSELIRQLIGSDPAYQFVERSEIARIREEHELGMFATSDPAERLELGRWLKAHLIVTGRFVDVGEPTQSLELTVIDTATAERVVKERIDFDQPLHETNRVSDARVEGLAEAVRGMLSRAHRRLVEARDERVVSFLFFRNASTNDRLDHMEFKLPDRIAAMAEEDDSVRLVRHHDPTLAMDEQELMLIGLSAGNADAWQTAADFYMWGLVEEQQAVKQDDAYNTGAQIDPDEIMVDVSLVLWHGLGDPIEVTESVAARDIEQAVDRASRRAWEIVRGEVPDTVSLQSRDKMVQLLLERMESIKVSTMDDPQSWQVRRFLLYKDRLNLAWFLDPENGNIGQKIAELCPATGVDQPWTYLRRALSQVNRVIRRHGVYEYRRVGVNTRPQRRNSLSRMIGDNKMAILTQMYRSCEGVNEPVDVWYRGFVGGFSQDMILPYLRLPADMPPEQRERVHDLILSEILSLGKEFDSAIREIKQHVSNNHRWNYRGFLFFYNDELEEMLLNLDHADPASRVKAWDLWWPILGEDWERTYSDPPVEYTRRERLAASRLSSIFTEAGEQDRFNRMYAPHVFAPAPEQKDVVQARVEPTNDYEALKREVAALQAEGKLPLPGVSDRSRRLEPDRGPTVPWSVKTAQFLKDDELPDQVRQNLELSIRRKIARFEDPDAFYLVPKQPDAPTLNPVGFPLTFWLPGHERMRVGDWSGGGAQFKEYTWHGERMLAIAGLGGSWVGRGDGPYRQRNILAMGPVSLATEPLHNSLPNEISLLDVESDGTALWLATRQDGLVRYRPDTGDYESYVGDDGLSSRHLSTIHKIGDRLLVVDRNGQFTIVSDLQETEPDIDALQLPQIKNRKHGLAGIAGQTLLFGNLFYDWYDLSTGRAVPVSEWLARHADQIVGEGDPIFVRSGGEHFWVMYVDKLVRISSDLSRFETWPTPIPPLDKVIIHEYGPVVWFAYSWEIEKPDRPSRLFNRTVSRDEEKWFSSRIVAWVPGESRVAGHWEVEGEAVDLSGRNGKLYVHLNGGQFEIIEYDLNRMAPALGFKDIDPASFWGDGEAGTILDSPHAMVWEAYRGDLDALRRRKEQGGLRGLASGRIGTGMLFAAIRGGHTETVRFLLESGVDANVGSGYVPQYTPVHLAALADRADILDLLHAHSAQLDVPSDSFGQALHAATQNRAYAAMRWLLDHGAPVDAYSVADREAVDGPGDRMYQEHFRPLMIAIAQGDGRAVEMLLLAGAGPSGGPRDYIPPISYAICKGHRPILERLLEEGADPGEHDGWDLTPVAYALNFGDAALAERLVEAGPEYPMYNPELILAAISLGSEPLVDKLLDSGIHVDTPFFPDGTMRMRIDLSSGTGGTTPALWAVQEGRIDIYDRLLAEKNINLDQPVGDFRQGDMLAYELMLRRYYGRSIDLVAKGYSIDVPVSSYGHTLIFSAAKRGDLEMTRLLLKLGADPNQVNEEGKRAIDLAEDPQVRLLLGARE